MKNSTSISLIPLVKMLVKMMIKFKINLKRKKKTIKKNKIIINTKIGIMKTISPL